MKKILTSIYFLLAVVQAWAVDTYNPTNGQLTIPLVQVGSVKYNFVVVKIAEVIHVGSAPATTLVDTYDINLNQLTMPSVIVGTFTYNNVVITVGSVVSIGVDNATSSNVFGLRSIKADLTPYPLSTYSYLNSKIYPANDVISSIGNYPEYNSTFYTAEPLAWGISDFMEKGKLSLFTAKIQYSTSDSYEKVIADRKNYSEYQFWELENNNKPRLVKTYQSNCLHPRKAIVADFNKDGISDIFIACHGYDASPFPGERSEILLSSSVGNYTLKSIGDIGFFHGASAADINDDGYIDIVVADSLASNVYQKNQPYVYFLMNNGDGTFAQDFKRIFDPDLFKLFYGQIYSIELIDINSDRSPDIVIGGYDGKNTEGSYTIQSKIYYGKNGKFGDQITLIPRIDDAGSVLDFIYREGYLYIARTDNSYRSNYIQKFNPLTLNNTIIYKNNPPNSNYPTWVGWWIPTKLGFQAWNTNLNKDLVPY